MVVDVELEERYWYPDEGGVVWVAGFQPVDPISGRYLSRDALELRARGIIVTRVAGAAQHHAEDLDAEAFSPGRPLALRRERDNPHDEHAISVRDPGGALQAGWVPRDLAAALAPRLDAGERLAAVALRETRASPRDPRTGLTMLVAPAERIVLREHPRKTRGRARP